MSFTLRETRMTAVWIESYPTLLSSTASNDVPLGKLAREGRYEDPFTDAIAGNGPFQTPWDITDTGRGENFFWKHYLGKSPREVKPDQAWLNLVPFKVAVPHSVRTTWDHCHGNIESFYYPHAIAVVVTIRTTEELEMAAVVDRATNIRSGPHLHVRWGDGDTHQFNLDKLGSAAISRVRSAALGPDAAPGQQPGTPFTIFTVIAGLADEKFDLRQPVVNGDDVHRPLDGLCTFSPTWNNNVLPSLESHRLRTKQSPASHLIYGRDRARSVWFPGHFRCERPSRKLGCYHRNLVFASMQTEALSSLLTMAADSFTHNRTMPSSMSRLTERACVVTGRLFDGNPKTYRSWSPHRQIIDSGSLPSINVARGHWGRTNLSSHD